MSHFDLQTKRQAAVDGRLPLILRPDNFTPPQRTPWGGTKIVERYKAALLEGDAPRIVGESWEVSVEPDFPATVQLRGKSAPDATEVLELGLRELIADNPVAFLGAEQAERLGGLALLVKLLDAREHLSVQIHPRDDDPALGPDESGKPETWYVLDAEEGAGLYLGLREGVTDKDIESTIAAEGDLSALLYFVPVQRGDFFVIDAGTAHAIGAGVTLLEPQRVLPGKRGLTYRYWDWNRKYDAEGRRDPAGQGRPLHLARALAVTNFAGPRERELLAQIHSRAPEVPLTDFPVHTVLGTDLASEAPAASGIARHLEVLDATTKPAPRPSRAEAVQSMIHVERVAGTGATQLARADVLRALTVVEGEVYLGTESGHTAHLRKGQSAVLPAASGPIELALARAELVVTWIL